MKWCKDTVGYSTICFLINSFNGLKGPEIMQKVKEVLNQYKRILRIIIPVLFIWGVYRVTPYLLMDKPVIDTITPCEILESTSFNDKNQLCLKGKNLKNITGIFINGIYESGCVITPVSEEEILLQLPSGYYSEAQELDIQIEVRINSDLTCLSPKAQLKVISDDIIAVPDITGSMPAILGYDGSLVQSITLEGSNFMPDSVVTVSGVSCSTSYDEDSENLVIQIPYENWCTEEILTLQVAQYYNGYPTRIKSKKYYLETILPEADTASGQYKWIQEDFIAQSFGEVNGITGSNSLEAFRYNYELGQRLFGVDLTFSSDSILYAAYRNKAEGAVELPISFETAQRESDLTLLRFEDICGLLQTYSDIYIYANLQDYENLSSFYVLCQYMLECAGQAGSEIMQRLIIPVRDECAYHLLMELCPFACMMYVPDDSALSEDGVLAFVRTTNIRAALLPWNKVNQLLCEELERLNCAVYVSGLKNTDEIIYALANGAKGISSILSTESWLKLKDDIQANAVDIPSISPEKAENYKILNDYLVALNSERYSIIFSMKDEASSQLSSSILRAMEDLGLEHAPVDAFRNSYLAVIDRKKVVYEECSDQLLHYDGTLGNINIHAESGGFNAGNISVIQINGIEYSVNRCGLNIVVYDNLLNGVMDSVCFDLYDSVMVTR